MDEGWMRKIGIFRQDLVRSSRISVQPKGVIRLLGAPCRKCGCRIIRATGDLIDGMCGSCHTAYGEEPPPAA